MGPRPPDLKAAKIRSQFETGAFGRWQSDWVIHPDSKLKKNETTSDAELETAAYLITKGMNDQESLAEICPAFKYEAFHRYQAQIYAKAQTSMNDREKRFEKFWSDPKLKPIQKRSLESVYMDNDEGISQRNVAKLTKVPHETLRARLRSGLKVLEKHFPEWTPLRKLPRSARVKGRNRELKYSFILIVIKYFGRRSPAILVGTGLPSPVLTKAST